MLLCHPKNIVQVIRPVHRMTPARKWPWNPGQGQVHTFKNLGQGQCLTLNLAGGIKCTGPQNLCYVFCYLAISTKAKLYIKSYRLFCSFCWVWLWTAAQSHCLLELLLFYEWPGIQKLLRKHQIGMIKYSQRYYNEWTGGRKKRSRTTGKILD